MGLIEDGIARLQQSKARMEDLRRHIGAIDNDDNLAATSEALEMLETSAELLASAGTGPQERVMPRLDLVQNEIEQAANALLRAKQFAESAIQQATGAIEACDNEIARFGIE